jgi:hypothetical protein
MLNYMVFFQNSENHGYETFNIVHAQIVWCKSPCYAPNLHGMLWSKPTPSKQLIIMDPLMFIIGLDVKQ